MSSDTYILPTIRSWFIEYSPLVSKCIEEYETILSQNNNNNNNKQINNEQLKTLLCKLVSYGDYSRAQTLLSSPTLFSGSSAPLAASVKSLLENYTKNLQILDRVPLNDFYRYLFLWRESCARLAASTSAANNVPLTSLLNVLLGEDDNSLSDSFVGVLLTRILYKRPDSTVYTLPQATKAVLDDFDIVDTENFCLIPCEVLCGNQDKLLSLAKKTGSSWFHGLLADILYLNCIHGDGSNKDGSSSIKPSELAAMRDTSIDEYASGLMSNLFFVHAINYAKTCAIPSKTAVHKDFLRRVSVGDDRTARKLIVASKNFAPEYVSLLHERIGVEKIRRAAYAEAMKHFILSGNMHLISSYAFALVSCEVDPSCDFKSSIVATGAVIRRCEYEPLRNEIGYVVLLADIYASLNNSNKREYVDRLCATLKSPGIPVVAKFRLIRDFAFELENDNGEKKVREYVTREFAMILVSSLEEVCLSYQSDKIFGMASLDDVKALRMTFSKLFI